MSKTIHQMPEADRPREKLLRKGAAALSDRELLAVLLGKGTPRMDVMTLAGKLARLIDEKGLEVKAEDLTQFAGVGRREGHPDSRGNRIRPPPHQAGGREDRNPGGSVASHPALRRPDTGALSMRQHQRRERSPEHPRRFDWPD